MASSSDAKDCGICGEEYDKETRCPRGLPCTHCICTDCTQQLINKNDKKCPFCRKGFEAKSAQDKSIVALDLLKYIKELEYKKETSTESPTKSRSKMVEEMKKSSYEMYNNDLESLKLAEESLTSIITENNKLKQCNSEKHKKLKDGIMDLLNTLKTYYEPTQKCLDGENNKINHIVKEVKRQQEKLEKVKVGLDAAAKFAQVDDAIDEIEAFHEEAQNCLQTYRKGLSGIEDIHTRIEKNDSIIRDKLNILKDILADIPKDNAKCAILQSPLTPKVLSVKTEEGLLRQAATDAPLDKRFTHSINPACQYNLDNNAKKDEGQHWQGYTQEPSENSKSLSLGVRKLKRGIRPSYKVFGSRVRKLKGGIRPYVRKKNKVNTTRTVKKIGLRRM